MTQAATTSLSIHYHVKVKGVLDRCAKEPEFIMAIEIVFFELWKGTRAEFDAIQAPKPYRKAYLESVKPFLDTVNVEFNSPILEWGTNLTGLNYGH